MGLSIAQRVANLPKVERRDLLSKLPEKILAEMLQEEWWFVARPEQIPPPGDWLICLFMAGRGAGKSRSSSEWIVNQVLKHPFDRSGNPTEWLVIAETLSDARAINVDGPSGIINVLRRRRIDHRYKQVPRPMILFPDGAKIYLEGADDPDVGRGYNAAGAVLDEIAKWRYSYDSWYQGIMPSLRTDLIDDHPRAFVTTTPKPVQILEEWVRQDDGSVHLITGSTFDNAANLSAHVLRELEKRYAGTSIGQQELYGKLLELSGGGLFKRMDLISNRATETPDEIVSIVVGADPNLTGEDAETGIVVACRTADDHMYVLADRTVNESGRAAALAMWRAVHEFSADLLVYEENLGKRYLQEVLQDAYKESVLLGMFPENTTPPMKAIHAKHGKLTRAEPVAQRSEQGRLHLVGEMKDLEDQMVLYDPKSTRESPDRMDALVHACLMLMSGEKRRMRIGNPNAYQFEDHSPDSLYHSILSLR